MLSQVLPSTCQGAAPTQSQVAPRHSQRPPPQFFLLPALYLPLPLTPARQV